MVSVIDVKNSPLIVSIESKLFTLLYILVSTSLKQQIVPEHGESRLPTEGGILQAIVMNR